MTETLVHTTRTDDIAILTIDRPPANALSQALRLALMQALRAAQTDAGVRAVVLACAGKTFVAGAEIAELGLPLEPTLPEVVALIEGLGKPTAAALHGTALGGGLELALGCTLRVARRDTRIGLPEVKLGMLPGAGGTVRTTWAAGADVALRLAGSGEMIAASAGADLGLIDALCDGDPVAAAVDLLRARMAAGDLPLPLAQRPRPAPVSDAALDAQCADLVRKARSNAPRLALASVRFAQSQPFDAALAHERALYLDAVASPTAGALRHLFRAERAAAKSGVDDTVAARPVARVGVIGAGTMGRGIAMAFANAGYAVSLSDTAQLALDAAMTAIAAANDGQARRGAISATAAAERTARVTPCVGLAAMADCDLIVEAAFEEMSVKTAIFAELDRLCRPGAILATNTSYLDVNTIAAATSRPGDVVGLHFFSPAHVMKLLEIVRARDTAPDVLQTASAVARRLGKQAVTVGVCRGFVGNRMLQARNRALPDLLCQGATPAQIDAAFRALGWPMGPFQMQDMAGLDISWRMRRAEGLSEPIADALCEGGRLGQKTGAGWYDHADGRATPSDAVAQVIARIAAARGITPRPVTDAEIIARTHDAMIAEGQALLAEGIARSADDIDVVWVHGYGFPRDLGGPMYWDANLRAKDRT